jgi:hypothetical protein
MKVRVVVTVDVDVKAYIHEYNLQGDDIVDVKRDIRETIIDGTLSAMDGGVVFPWAAHIIKEVIVK